MTAFAQIIAEMDSVLDQLIEMAEHMKELSQQVIAEKEVMTLQKKEQDLINKLIELDMSYQKIAIHLSAEERGEFQNKIETKLSKFQQLNTKFIENIAAGRGLIHFQAKHKH